MDSVRSPRTRVSLRLSQFLCEKYLLFRIMGWSPQNLADPFWPVDRVTVHDSPLSNLILKVFLPPTPPDAQQHLSASLNRARTTTSPPFRPRRSLFFRLSSRHSNSGSELPLSAPLLAFFTPRSFSPVMVHLVGLSFSCVGSQ